MRQNMSNPEGKMVLRSIHSLIKFPQLLKLLLGIAAIVQLIVITFTHMNGYFVLDDSLHFLTRFVQSTFLSLIAAFLLAYPDLFIIRYLNAFFPWEKRTFTRTVIQFLLSIVVAVTIAISITTLSHVINPYREGLLLNTIYNVLIVSVCNIILMIILEAWLFFIEGADSKRRSKDLENELSQIRFEILKSQLNSHFMFNSLNVLSGLIETDTKKAQLFIDEFSSIYRYVLDTIEKPVVTVKEELGFARSYMFLQQIRYGKHLKFTVDLPTELLNAFLPPLSLQVVLENACKHNLVNDEQPLKVDISSKDKWLVISNNIQLKMTSGVTSGTGQQNLAKRYAILSNNKPEFRVGTTHYTVTLPLIVEENL